MLWAPGLDSVLQMEPHEDMVGPLGRKCTLPVHTELLIDQHPQVLLLRAALSLYMSRITLTQVQHLAFRFENAVRTN